MYGILLVPIRNHIKLLFPVAVLASLSIATLHIDDGLSKSTIFKVQPFPFFPCALAQEDADKDAEDAADGATGEEGINAKANSGPPNPDSIASFTISGLTKGNASMLPSNLPLVKRMMVRDGEY